MKKIQDKNKLIVEKLRNGLLTLLESYKVTILEGKARFESSQHIHITKKDGKAETIRFRKAIVATGSGSFVPKNIKLDKKIITSRTALLLKEIPKSVVILGAGYIAAELGTFFSQMGSIVTIIARSRLLSKMDEDLVKEVERNSEFKVYQNTLIKSVNGGSRPLVVVNKEGKDLKLNANLVIVAIGRVPNTREIGLENTRVTLDKDGFIIVNKKMCTSDQNIYAAGDVVGGVLLAHKAFMQGKVAAEAIAGIKSAGFEQKVIPEIVFTAPEIAIVGLSEIEAAKKGYSFVKTKLPFSAVGKSVAIDNHGFVKILHDKNGRVLGISIVSKNASEIIGEAGLAIELGAYVDDIAETIHAHPTLHEGLHECAELALEKPWHFFKQNNKS